MSGYEVVLKVISDAASATRELAEQGTAIDVAGALSQAPTALAGSRAEDALRDLARVVRENTTQLGEDTTAYATNLSTAVDYYRAHEKRARETLELPLPNVGPSERGPR